MSGMILGGMLEADKRMISYQHRVRYQKRLARDCVDGWGDVKVHRGSTDAAGGAARGGAS
jgi:hypothetical protein